MKKAFLHLAWIIVIVSISSCTFNRTYINSADDNREGEQFVNQFYSNVAGQKLMAIDSMVSDTLRKVAGPNGISKLVTLIHNKAGDYKTDSIADHYITRSSGSDNFTSYNYKIKVTYANGVVDEMIGMRKSDKGKVEMVAYHANSDILLK